MARKAKTEDELVALQKQLETERAVVNYSISEFTIEILIKKLVEGDIVIPEYQRQFVWKADRKSRFIESLILQLPVPFLFSADVGGNLEVVDGTQRLRTLRKFLEDDLTLSDLELVQDLNGFRFGDLPVQEQKRFKNRSIRMIELSSSADLAVRFELFNRINSGSATLTDAEFRKGAFPSRLYKKMIELGSHPAFRKVCPISKSKEERGEAEELVLRFFAYSETYQDFKHDVGRFLNRYLARKCEEFDAMATSAQDLNLERHEERLVEVVQFVDEHFPNGFRRTERDKTTPRVRFEALAVGARLALTQEPELKPESVADWLSSDEFLRLTRSDGSNSGPRLAARVEFVRNKLLGS